MPSKSNTVAKKLYVVTSDTTTPRHMIQPKSFTGRMSLLITPKNKKAVFRLAFS